MSDCIVMHASNPQALLLLAHGAGAGSRSDFMQALAASLNHHDISVMLLDFPYMQMMYETGKRRPPDRMPLLCEAFSQAVNKAEQEAGTLSLWLGGKSMGGRVASMLLTDNDIAEKVKGAMVFGYPFHPPGKLDKWRTEHFSALKKPLIVFQGERDTFGTEAELQQLTMPDSVSVSYMSDGDHSFKPRKKSGLTQQQHIESAARMAAELMKESQQ